MGKSFAAFPVVMLTNAVWKGVVLSRAVVASVMLTGVVLAGMSGVAQAAPAPTSQAANQPVRQTESSPLRENFGDWRLTCEKRQGATRCLVSQQILDRRTHQRVISLSLEPLDHQVRGQALMPFGLDLAKGMTLSLSSDPLGLTLPYTTCRADGCVVPLDFDDAQMEAFLKATTVKMNFSLLNGREIDVPLSLKGFSAAWTKAVSLSGVQAVTLSASPTKP